MRLKLSREQKIAHRFLSSFHMVADRMDSSIECLERAESARTSISASIGAMSFSGEQHDKMLNAMLRMDSAIDEIGELADGYSEQFKEVEGYVSAVQRIDPQAGKALRKVYIEGLSAQGGGGRRGLRQEDGLRVPEEGPRPYVHPAEQGRRSSGESHASDVARRLPGALQELRPQLRRERDLADLRRNEARRDGAGRLHALRRVQAQEG